MKPGPLLLDSFPVSSYFLFFFLFILFYLYRFSPFSLSFSGNYMRAAGAKKKKYK